MNRWLLNTFTTWELGFIVVGGFILFAVVGLVVFERLAPDLRQGEVNDVTGVILGVLAAIYGIVLAFVIVSLYDDLMALNPSPVAALNRAVAIAMIDGAGAGIDAVESIEGRESLRNYPLLYSTLGELWLRRGDRERAAEEFSRALELPSSMPEKRFLLRKLEACR